ncbi:hypothetical protein D3C84_176920 [compost metagenome]
MGRDTAEPAQAVHRLAAQRDRFRILVAGVPDACSSSHGRQAGGRITVADLDTIVSGSAQPAKVVVLVAGGDAVLGCHCLEQALAVVAQGQAVHFGFLFVLADLYLLDGCQLPILVEGTLQLEPTGIGRAVGFGEAALGGIVLALHLVAAMGQGFRIAGRFQGLDLAVDLLVSGVGDHPRDRTGVCVVSVDPGRGQRAVLRALAIVIVRLVNRRPTTLVIAGAAHLQPAFAVGTVPGFPFAPQLIGDDTCVFIGLSIVRIDLVKPALERGHALLVHCQDFFALADLFLGEQTIVVAERGLDLLGIDTFIQPPGQSGARLA